MRCLKPALLALVLVALCAPTIGSADSSAGGQLATAAKKCKAKGKASAAKKKKCKAGKKPGGQAPGGQKPGAGAPPPPDPTGNTVITLTGYTNASPTPGNNQVFGTVTSTNAACLSGRVMTLFEDLLAGDEVRDTATVTSGFLIFDFPAQISGDDFYAVATQDTVGSVACGPATSNLISKL